MHMQYIAWSELRDMKRSKFSTQRWSVVSVQQEKKESNCYQKGFQNTPHQPLVEKTDSSA